jgi:dethiobiotin synthetase
MRLFITSTGTGIGKSFITAGLARQARAHGQTIAAYKPVISGFDPAEVEESDTGILLDALGLPMTQDNIERISPWRFAAPLAPSMAGRLENRPIDFDALVAHSRKMLQGPEETILIEGVGGVMAPLTDHHTVLDWIEALGAPALLVVGTCLGGISHTLTALETLKQRKISVHALIVNESENSSATLEQTVDELKLWTDMPLQIQNRLKQL